MTDTTTSARREPRPEDPRARAAARAAELRGHLGDMDEGVDKFYVAPGDVPEGWTYEWKRQKVLGAEDPSYEVQLARQGWEAVPASRHPSYMPKDGKFATIERDGMVLMERPTEIVEEARNIELRRARNQVRQKEAQLSSTPEGTLPRDADPRTKPRINKGYEPIPIPD